MTDIHVSAIGPKMNYRWTVGSCSALAGHQPVQAIVQWKHTVLTEWPVTTSCWRPVETITGLVETSGHLLLETIRNLLLETSGD